MKENKSQVHYGWWSAEESEWSLNNNKNGNVIRIKKVVPLDALLIFQLCLTTKDETIDQWVKKRERDGEHRDEKEKFNWVRLRVSQSHFGRSLFFPGRLLKGPWCCCCCCCFFIYCWKSFRQTEIERLACLSTDRCLSLERFRPDCLHIDESHWHTHTHILYIRETDTKDTEIDGFPRLRTFESLVCLPSDYTSISVIPTGSE